MLNLRKERVIELQEYSRRGGKVDEEMIHQCGYYPGPPSLCNRCSMAAPNSRCKRAHILVDTQISPPSGPWKHHKVHDHHPKLDELLKGISPEARVKVMELIK
jgi:hypothetical protein